METTNYDRVMSIMDFESDEKNFTIPFGKCTSKYGKPFIEMIQAMWAANGESQTEEEFCKMNDIPKGFFDKKIKNDNPFYDEVYVKIY